jgi:gliding motility-associated-like protein
MIGRVIICAFLLAAFYKPAVSQDIIYVDTTFSIFVPKTVFGSIDLGQCFDNYVDEELSYQFSYDILVRQDGKIFGFGVRNGFQDTSFFQVTPLSPNSVANLPLAITYNHEIRGLTCDENGYAYAAGRGITQTKTECCDHDETYLGDLPPDMQCLGDITYREGKFYLSAIGNKLVEVNMKDISKSQIVMEFPPGTLPIQGLTTVQLGCDSVATYAIGRAWNHSVIYEIDFNNWTLTQVCDMPLLAIDGAGNQTECALPPCEVFVDLDDDNSSFGFWGNYCADTFCIPPSLVTDTDVVILSASGVIDSITLELAQVFNTGDEFLASGVVNNIVTVGNNTTNITLINNGSASVQDFEVALKSVQYFNDAPSITYGIRKVLVTAWAGGESSIVSVAELPLGNNVLQLQAGLQEPGCYGFMDGSIFVETTGGVAPYSYQWASGQTGDLLNNLSAGIYPIIISDATGCVKSDTISLTEPDTLTATISYAGLPAICDNSGELAAVTTGGTTPYSFEWSNGVVSAINDNVGPGTYELTATDSNGCQAIAEYTVATGDTVLVVQFEEICEGGSFAWGGNTFYSDTMACEVVVMPNGCDSSHCLSLKTNPLPQIELVAEGNFCTSNEIAISSGQYNSYLWSTGETSPSILVTSPGAYSITVTNNYNCASSDTITISPGIEFDYTAVNPTCFGDKNGSIIIDNVSGGNSPWFYSIDEINFFPDGAFENLEAGGYSLVVEDIFGCRKEVPVLLEAPAPIIVEAGDDKEIKIGANVTLTAVTNIADPTASWYPPDYLDCTDCLVVNAQPLKTIQYEIQVIGENDCAAKDSITIFVDTATGVYIPNAFSPNGDGINDRFTVYASLSVSKVKSLRIFNRWGDKVFESTNFLPNEPGMGWDGTFKGKKMPAGVYVFRVELQRIDDKTEVRNGEVTLLR